MQRPRLGADYVSADEFETHHTKQGAAQTVLVQSAMQQMLDTEGGQTLALWDAESFAEQFLSAFSSAYWSN